MRMLEPRQRPVLATPQRAHLEDDRSVRQFGLRRQIDPPLHPSAQDGQQTKTCQLVTHAGRGHSRRLRVQQVPPTD